MGPQANQSQLSDTAFMVYNNQDLEEGKKEQIKEKQQARIMAVMIGKALVTQEMSRGPIRGSREKGSCFKCKKTGHWAKDHQAASGPLSTMLRHGCRSLALEG